MARPAFEVVHDPPHAEIDIIAVHGLGANADWTWIWKDPKTPSTQVRWLSDPDMLPAVIPNARVVLYSYDSRWHSDAPRISLHICGDRFIQMLHDFRGGLFRRPIVFLGHSLGSVVIQQGLLIADTRDDLRYLTHATSGVVTLGSPLRGIKKKAQPSFLVKLLQFRGSWGGIIDELKYENDALLEKLERFIRLAKARHFGMFCFFELYETKFGKKLFFGGKFGVPLSAMIVPETSACVSGFERCGLQADHFRINKYSGPNDASFVRVSAQLLQMCTAAMAKAPASPAPAYSAKRAPQPLAPLPRNASPEETDRFLRRLFLTNPMDDLRAMQRVKGDRAEGTCEWIIHTDEFKAWLSPSQAEDGIDAPNFMWLQGNPGVGKSTMAMFLVEHLQDIDLRNEQCSTAFFFCSSGNATRNSAIAILRGLLWQLLSRHQQLIPRHLLPAYRLQGGSIFDSFDILWSAFLDVVNDEEIGVTHVIIDGLDECREQAVFALVRQLRRAINQGGFFKTSHRCRLLILSRPSPGIQRALRNSRTIDLSTRVELQRDISKFIEEKVADLEMLIPYPPLIADTVTKILRQNAEGTFLWIGMACAELERHDAKDAVHCLESLPSTLNDIYQSILNSACGSDGGRRVKVKQILGLATTALYPLSLYELSVVCNLHTDESGETRVAFMREEIESCRRLLVIDEGRVHVLHESVKDFLHSDASGPLIDEAQAHAQLAHRCIEFVYWSSIDLETSHSRRLLWSGSFEWSRFDPTCGRVRQSPAYEVPEKDLFLGYAVFRWPEHARLALDSFAVTGLARLFFDKRSLLWQAWSAVFLPYVMHSSVDEGHSESYGGCSWQLWNALDVAALTNSPKLAQYALEQQGSIVEGRQLMYAAAEHNWSMFESLLGNLFQPTVVLEEAVESFLTSNSSSAFATLRALFDHRHVRVSVTPTLLLRAAQREPRLFDILFGLRSADFAFTPSSVESWMQRWGNALNHARFSKLLAEYGVPGFVDSTFLLELLVTMDDDYWLSDDQLDMIQTLCNHPGKETFVTPIVWYKAVENPGLGCEILRILPERDFPSDPSEREHLLMMAASAGKFGRGAEILHALSEKMHSTLSDVMSTKVLFTVLESWGDPEVRYLVQLPWFDSTRLHEEDMLACACSNTQASLGFLFWDLRIPSSCLTEKILLAAARNQVHGRALFAVLLELYVEITPLPESVVFEAAQNADGLLKLLLDLRAFPRSIITLESYQRIELSTKHSRSGNFSRNLIELKDSGLPVPSIVPVARYLPKWYVKELLEWQGAHITTKDVLLVVMEEGPVRDSKEDLLPLLHSASPDLPIINSEFLDVVLSSNRFLGFGGPRAAVERVREVRGGYLLPEEGEAVRLWWASHAHLAEQVDFRKEFLEARRKYLNYDPTGERGYASTHVPAGTGDGGGHKSPRRRASCCLHRPNDSSELEDGKRRASMSL